LAYQYQLRIDHNTAFSKYVYSVFFYSSLMLPGEKEVGLPSWCGVQKSRNIPVWAWIPPLWRRLSYLQDLPISQIRSRADLQCR